MRVRLATFRRSPNSNPDKEPNDSYRMADTCAAILALMTTWLFRLVAICFLALIWIAQWLDWESGIQDRQLSRHFKKSR